MMKKLKLELDELAVETFTTEAPSDQAPARKPGTVHGQGSSGPIACFDECVPGPGDSFYSHCCWTDDCSLACNPLPVIAPVAE